VIAEIVRVIRFLDDLDDLGVVGQAAEIGVRMRLVPASREGQLLVGREVLVAEIDHAMVKHRPVDRREGGVVETSDIDALDLGAKRAREREDFDRHDAGSVRGFSTSVV
jgi:hypothetical protein